MLLCWADTAPPTASCTAFRPASAGFCGRSATTSSYLVRGLPQLLLLLEAYYTLSSSNGPKYERTSDPRIRHPGLLVRTARRAGLSPVYSLPLGLRHGP